jgi:hypothetical protein
MWEQGGEMTQALSAHMKNKIIFKKYSGMAWCLEKHSNVWGACLLEQTGRTGLAFEECLSQRPKELHTQTNCLIEANCLTKRSETC